MMQQIEPAPMPAPEDFQALAERAERLQRERDLAIKELERVEQVLKVLRGEEELPRPNLTRGKRHRDVAAESSPLMLALTGEWQTVKELHKAAQAHGYTGVENLLRYHMPKLIEAHPGRIERQDKPLAWRLSPEEKADK